LTLNGRSANPWTCGTPLLRPTSHRGPPSPRGEAVHGGGGGAREVAGDDDREGRLQDQLEGGARGRDHLASPGEVREPATGCPREAASPCTLETCQPGPRPAYSRRSMSMGVEPEDGAAEPVAPTTEASKVPPPEPEWADDVCRVPDCPPAAATPTSGPVYRRLTADGHKTYAELGKCAKERDPRRLCQGASLSCCLSLEALRARMPSGSMTLTL